VPPMRGCDEARPQAPASAAAVWAGHPLMWTVRIRRNRRTRARSPTTEVASTDARCTIFPVSYPHSRTPMIRHGRPAKDEADLSSVRGAHEARQAIALARPQTPRDPAVSVHRLRACRHGRVARARGRILAVRTRMPRLIRSKIPSSCALLVGPNIGRARGTDIGDCLNQFPRLGCSASTLDSLEQPRALLEPDANEGGDNGGG